MDDNLWGNLEPVTGAASKRPSMQDAPTKQPMKAGIKPAQQKSPSGDQKKFRRRQMTKRAGQDTCPQCGSPAVALHSNHNCCNTCGFMFNDDGSEYTHGGLSPHPDHTGAIQIQTSSRTTTKESTMTEQNQTPEAIEAGLLARLASATTLTEQAALAALLDDHRAKRREAISAEGSLDWGAMDTPTQHDGPSAFAAQYIQTTASAVSEPGLPSDTHVSEHLSNHRTSADSDWLMDMVPDEVDEQAMTTAMRAEAVGWYENGVWAPVKDSHEEFSVQAHNAAARVSSAYGLRATAAASVFIDTVDHLYRKDRGASIKTADWGNNNMPGAEKTTDTYVSDGKTTTPVGIDPAKVETFDEHTLPGADGNADGGDPKTETSKGDAPSLAEGAQPESDHSESPENPLTGDTSVDKSTFDVGNVEDKMNTQGAFFHHNKPEADGPMGAQSEWDNLARQVREQKARDEEEKARAATQTNPATAGLNMFEALSQPTALEYVDGGTLISTADAQSSEWGLGLGIDEGETPEGDHAESPVQNTGEGATDQSGDGQGWPTNPGTGGTGDATRGAAPGTPYHSSLSPNAQVFVQALQSMSSLDDVVAGVSGHQIVDFLAKDPTVPENVREALKAGGNPFVREVTATPVAKCKHCGRRITKDADGRWVDPEATGDDSVWRETCDEHDTFTAEHEPEWGTAYDDQSPDTTPSPDSGNFRPLGSITASDPWGGKKDMNGDDHAENSRKFQERNSINTGDRVEVQVGRTNRGTGEVLGTEGSSGVALLYKVKLDSGETITVADTNLNKVSVKTAGDQSPGRWIFEVAGSGENVWSRNGMGYDSREEAAAAAKDLAGRWFGMDMARVRQVPEGGLPAPHSEAVDSADPDIVVNYRTASKLALEVKGPDGQTMTVQEGECRTCGRKILGVGGKWVHDPRDSGPSHPDGSVAGDAHGIVPKEAAGDPVWLTERNNDPYGTNAWGKPHEFWSTVDYEDMGGKEGDAYRVFEKDGRWFAYHRRQNYWMKLNAKSKDEARAEVGGMNANLDMWASRKSASISLTNVGLDGDNGVGTDPQGNRVTFRLTPKERADLSAVLYSDLAGNFSGVSIEESDIIKSGSVTSARDTGTCTCGRGISYDRQDRKWTHDTDGTPAHGKAASKTAGDYANYKGPAYYVVIGGTRTVLAGPFASEADAQAKIDSGAIFKSAYEIHFIEQSEAPEYDFLPDSISQSSALSTVADLVLAESKRGPSYNPSSTKDLPLHGTVTGTEYYYNEGYDHAVAGQDRKGYGSRDKTILYSHGYEHGLKDKGKSSSLSDLPIVAGSFKAALARVLAGAWSDAHPGKERCAKTERLNAGPVADQRYVRCQLEAGHSGEHEYDESKATPAPVD